MTSRPDQTWGRPPFSEPNWGMRQGMRMPASLGSRMAFTTVLGMSWLFMKTLTKVCTILCLFFFSHVRYR